MGLTGTDWNGEIRFWTDWNGLKRRKLFLVWLEWFGVAKVRFGWIGMTWNGGSWVWPDENGLKWRKSVLAWLEWLRMEAADLAKAKQLKTRISPKNKKGNRKKFGHAWLFLKREREERKKEKYEGFPRPGGNFVAPGNKK
jgi:hypothetical protein